MKKVFGYVAAGTALMILAGCSSKSGDDNKKGALDEWNESLNDSIEFVKAEIDSCQNNLDILHDKVSGWLEDFTYVNNSREVEGYTIYKGWDKKYPLTSTGLIARITENEQLELVAAYRGAPFTSITVETPDGSASSDVVERDQGLNYRVGDMTTVAFTGEKANEIARLVADNELNNIKVIFVGTKAVGNYSLPAGNKQMIAATWMLYDGRRNSALLEKRIPMLNEKIRIFRQMQDKYGKKSEE